MELWYPHRYFRVHSERHSPHRRRGRREQAAIFKDYSTLYSCDFESGQTLSTKATLEDAATVTSGWTSTIVEDEDNTSNHVYKIHKDEQNISCFAVNIPLGSGIKAGTGKYVVSYDLKVPGKSENHLIQLLNRSYGTALQTE